MVINGGGLRTARIGQPAQDDGGAGVLKVRLGGDAHQTRIVIELDRSVQGRLIAGETAARTVVMSLPQVGAPGVMQGAGAGLVKSWSVQDASGGARIKLDLVRPALIKRRFLLAPGDGIPVYRYVIDLAEDGLDAAPTPLVTAGTDLPPRDQIRPQKVKAPLQPLQPVVPS